MKRLLLILIPFLLYSCGNYQASRGPANWIYVSQTGDDGTGDGSSGNPFATVSHAATTASSGDTIYVQSGTIVETAQTALPVGVSIYGGGATSIITTATALSPIIYLSSGSEGTNGNQSISYIKIDGDLTAVSLIYVSGRSNVDIHDCTFIDALNYGVTFRGKVNTADAAPTTYATGNKFRDNIMTNCAIWSTSGRGNLEFSGQDGLLIYGNSIIQTDRGTGYHGHGIKSVINTGYSRGVKIHDNTIAVPDHEGNGFYFGIEIWNQWGMEIYDNVIRGGVDMGGNFSGYQSTYDYAISIHDNIIGPEELGAEEGVVGIYLEGDCELTRIYRNWIKNVGTGIYINPFGSASDYSVLGRYYHIYEDIYIYYNVLKNIGQNALGSDYKGWGVRLLGADDYDHQMDNINILNNVLVGDTDATSTFSGIFVHAFGDITNMTIRNNIGINFDYAPSYMANGSVINTDVDILSIENNDFYNNGYSNVPRYGSGCTPTNNTTQNNITSSPAFKTGKYRLQSSSPCKDAGLNVSLTSDYAGHDVPQHTTPDMGAFEYGDYLVQLPSGNLLRNANGKLMYIH